MKSEPVGSTAEAYLGLLAARGVEYLFGNGGTDFAPIVQAYMNRYAHELPVPTPVAVPHEITATAMAAGYAMVTRRPQAVMVHTVPGTANATGNLINAHSSNVPILFTAGRTPITESGFRGSRNGGVAWAQESRDQGAMLREWVKWDYELRSGVDLEGVVDRALAISQSEPQGPVYLILPREVLAEERAGFSFSERPRMQPSAPVAGPEAIDEVAALLAKARNPIAITAASGRDPESVPQLVRLAETLGMPVFSTGTYMNFPVTHPLHQPYPVDQVLHDADVVLVIEHDAPWLPSISDGPDADATVVSIGIDPLFTGIALRSFPAHHNLAGLPRHTFGALATALIASKLDKAAIAERGERWRAAHDAGRERIHERALAGKTKRPLDRSWVTYCLEQFRDDDTMLVIEHGMDPSQFEFTQPDQFYRVPSAGVLGWAVGAALGAKLAAPEKTVIACMGDGSYLFGVPSAGHWLSRNMNLPVLYIVWDNARWGSVTAATRDIYPQGHASRTGEYAFSDLGPSIDFVMLCEAAGGYAERVEDPDHVSAAIERALRVVRDEKRQALLSFAGE
jgi:acetolactate synthase-1/2/3 large subunit